MAVGRSLCALLRPASQTLVEKATDQVFNTPYFEFTAVVQRVLRPRNVLGRSYKEMLRYAGADDTGTPSPQAEMKSLFRSLGIATPRKPEHVRFASLLLFVKR